MSAELTRTAWGRTKSDLFSRTGEEIACGGERRPLLLRRCLSDLTDIMSLEGAGDTTVSLLLR